MPVTGAISALVLGACSSVPEHLQGEYTTITPEQASVEDIGTSVRWGGEIFDSWHDDRQVCFAVRSRLLDSTTRPRVQESAQGPFLACAGGDHDSEAFAKGKEVTLIGSIQGVEQDTTVDAEAQLPLIAVRSVTVWADMSSMPGYRSPAPRPVMENPAGPRP